MRPSDRFCFSPEKLRTERAGRSRFLGAEIASVQVSSFSPFFVCSQLPDLLFFVVFRCSHGDFAVSFSVRSSPIEGCEQKTAHRGHPKANRKAGQTYRERSEISEQTTSF
jgi:hypothetical protein